MADVAIIGGGAAGLCAAIAAATGGDKVTIYEADNKVGNKILATGNGRCNLTNLYVKPSDYNVAWFVKPTLEKLGPKQLRAWFQQIGLLTVEEREGRVYPLSNAANSVLDVLRMTYARLGVEVVYNARAVKLSRGMTDKGPGVVVTFADGTKVGAEKVVVTCGGGSQLLATCGHTLEPEQPVLCALATDTDSIRGLSGVRVRARLQLRGEGDAIGFSEVGEVLFRDYGISGVVTFNASRWARPGQTLSLDLLPQSSTQDVVHLLRNRAKWTANYTDLLCGIFHPQVNRALLRAAGCKLSMPVEMDAAIEKIAALIKDFSLTVKGPANTKQAQVTRGGAALDEFDPHTLESTIVPGLYAAGECLNIDAPCGGYNLHWAWCSGLVAGSAQ